jgi:hypothetical protein
VRAVIEQAFEDQVEPVLQRALSGEVEPFNGLAEVLEAAMAMASAHRNALAAAKGAAWIGHSLVPSFFERLSVVLGRAQQQGTIRGDLQPRDLPRLVSMLVTTMWFDESGEAWRRYLVLMLDGLQTRTATPLPPLGEIGPLLPRHPEFKGH